MSIEFFGSYERNAFFQAVSLLNRPARRTLLLRGGLAFIVFGLFILYLVTVVLGPSSATQNWARTARFLISIFIILCVLLQPFFSHFTSASKMWKKYQDAPPVFGSISSQGIIYQFKTGQKEIAWDLLIKLRKTDQLIAMLAVDGTLHLLARSFFNSEEDWIHAVQMASAKVIEPR